MGLAEKKITAEIKTKMTEWEGDIVNAAGIPVVIEVEWDTIVKEGAADYAMDAFEKIFIDSTAMALKEISLDDIGKSALAAGLKKIIIKNVSDNYSAGNWCQFENGTITLDHSFSNISDVKQRSDSMIDVLNSAL